MKRTLVDILIDAERFLIHRRQRVLDGLIVARNDQRTPSCVARARRARLRRYGVAGLRGGGSFARLAGDRSLADYRNNREGATIAKNEDGAEKVY